ncbi:MAG TPA: cytochrome c oxidase subunit II [Burkholderiales bacterium]|nr:cytochrome c oxidase subunit II [Burkholderiales bacterium]
MIRTIARSLTGLFLTVVGGGLAHAEMRLNLQQPETIIAHEIYELHTVILLICVVIFIVVFGAMFYALWKHRKSVGHRAEQFHENTTVEIIWTVIPFLILIGMAIPATRTVLAMKDTSSPDLTIKATGFQWKWRYDYLDEDIGFYSALTTPLEQIENHAPKGEHYLLEVDNPMVVPIGKKVRILATANDVIHAWWVPAFGVKQDAIPGFVRDTWFKVDTPGTYRGQCAELCGKDHGFMPIVVEAVDEGKYKEWVAQQQSKKSQTSAAAAADVNKTYTLDDLKSEGEKVYGKTCVACHQASGQGMPPTFPSLAGGKISTGPIAAHIDIVVNGSKKNPAMVAWKNQLSDLEIAGVITYERNSFGNKLGDMVQPKDIAAARK